MRAALAIALALLNGSPEAEAREHKDKNSSTQETPAVPEPPPPLPPSPLPPPPPPPLSPPTPERYSPVLSGTLVTFGSQIAPPGKLVIRPVFSFTSIRGAYDATGSYRALNGDELFTALAMQLYVENGVGSRVSMGTFFSTQLKFAHNATADAQTLSLSDAVIFTRVSLLQEWKFLPGVTMMQLIKLPVGNAIGDPAKLGTDLSGTGGMDVGLGLNLTKTIKPLLFHATATYFQPLPARINGVDTRYAGNLSWSIATEWPFWRNQLGLQAEVAGRTQAGPKLDGVSPPGLANRELLLGLGMEVLFRPNFQMIFSYQRSLSGRNAPAFDSVLVAFVPVLF